MDIAIATRTMVLAIAVSVVLLFVGIGILVLIHVYFVGRALRAGLDLNNLATLESGPTGNDQLTHARMSQEDIDRLPSYEFTDSKSKGSMENHIEATDTPIVCAVCLDHFKFGEKCRLLPLCMHSFHADCVDTWLLKTPICPICRSTADSRSVSDQESSLFGDSVSHSIDMSGSQVTSTTTQNCNHISFSCDASVQLRESNTP